MKKKSTKLVTRENHLTFSRLISAIQETDRYFASQASKSVNVSLTLRNWVIGFYIRAPLKTLFVIANDQRERSNLLKTRGDCFVTSFLAMTFRRFLEMPIREYEQNGSDRAKYGQQLLVRLSGQLEKTGSLKYDPRELRRCRAFYDVYPQLWGTVSPKLGFMLPAGMNPAFGTKVTDISASRIRGTASPKLGVPPEKLLTNLSFSHFAELIELDDPLKRVFYEIESMRVRHLWNA